MPAPTSPVEICRLALDYVGERANITSIENPENVNELRLARHYDLTRQNLLREYIWNFSRTETTLARVGDGGFDYQDRFLMPNDCLRLIKMGTRLAPIRVYNINGRDILINLRPTNELTSVNALELRYVKDVTDVSLFDTLFVKLLALQLAVNISYAISEKRSQVEMINGLLKQELPKAVSVNSQEKKPMRRDRSRWLDARYYGDYFYGPKISEDGVYWLDIW